MSATLEPIVVVAGVAVVWIVRSGPEHRKFGDPYALACVVVRRDDRTAELLALASGVTSAADLWSIRKVLRRAWFARVRWQRVHTVDMPLRGGGET